MTVIVQEAPRPAEAKAGGAKPGDARDETGPLQKLVRQDAPAAPVRERSRAVALPAILPGDILQPIRGGAVRIVENMEASLQIPTATSMRTLPVRTLEENRRLLNKHREARGRARSASRTSWRGRSCARSTPSRA